MKKIIWTAILTMTVLLTGCAGAPAQELERTEFFAMDTAMEFTVYGEANLLDEAKSIISSVEEQVSVTDEHSVLYTINHTGTGKLTGNSAELMEKALEQAKENGFTQVELGVFADNDRARYLYRKLGFTEMGCIPKAFCLKDGTYRDEVQMVKFLMD